MEYSTSELQEIIYKKDEWNELDYEIAKKLLKDRGEDISDEKIKGINIIRLQELTTRYENPKEVKAMIILGYIFAIIGGFASMIWGILIFVSYAISLVFF